MNEFESAKGDFEKVLEVNPQNKAARLQISMCQKKAKEHNERDRRIYANMFKKFAEQDAKVCTELSLSRETLKKIFLIIFKKWVKHGTQGQVDNPRDARMGRMIPDLI